MAKNRWLNFFKKWHKWPSLIFALLFLLWAVSGILLNHRQLFSGWDVSRNYLPEEYRYRNWNNAALKSALTLGKDSILLYGNAGIWLTDDRFRNFRDFNAGFPAGIDNRKIFCMLKTGKGNLYAGTLFGLYHYDRDAGAWEKVPLPTEHERVTALGERNGSIQIMTRYEILEGHDDPENFATARTELPPPDGYDNKESLFRTFWVIHSGELYGTAGRLIIDAVGIILIFLTVTGILHYIAPFIIRRRKKRKLSTVKVTGMKRFTFKWHKKIGVWIVLLLLVNVVTGMFLRPPLLIPIASSRVGKIPWSMLDSDNAWADKLRDFTYDENLGGYLVSTSEGMYFSPESLTAEPVPLAGQPPVSVMGINAFHRRADGTYIIGSFSGLYRWNPLTLHAENYLTGDIPGSYNTSSRPLSDHMVAGYLTTPQGYEYYMDYNLGAVPVHHHHPFATMPANILENSPMSLWNLALEFHTARILKVVVGDFYILVIPLMGLFGSIILISGIVVWWKLLLRRKKRPGFGLSG